MEFEQIQNGEFSEKSRKRLRHHRILIVLLVLIFLSLIAGCFFWFNSKYELTDLEINDPAKDREVLEGLDFRADFQGSLSPLEQKFFDLSKRVDAVEQKFITLKKSKKAELSGEKQVDSLKAEMESLTDSFSMRFEELKNKSSEPQIELTTLITMENYLIRANRYLSDKKDPRNASIALKSAESLVVQLAPDLRLILSEILLREISKLEQLAEMPIYELPRMLNKLVSLIGNLAIDTKMSSDSKSNQESQSLETASSKGVIKSLWIELRSLVTVNEIDHELVNQFSTDDARLVRLNLQLEAAIARAAFLAGNLDLLETSLNNLENLCQTYLSERSPIVELLMKISKLDLDLLSEEERHLRDLVKQVRNLRLSHGSSG